MSKKTSTQTPKQTPIQTPILKPTQIEINEIKNLINIVNNVNSEYKQYCSLILMEFNKIIIFDANTKNIYDNKFNILNNRLKLYYRDNLFPSIQYADNLYNKYKFEHKVTLFSSPFYQYREYVWINDISKMTLEYYIYDLYILLNYLLDRLIKYNSNRILGERNNDLSLSRFTSKLLSLK